MGNDCRRPANIRHAVGQRRFCSLPKHRPIDLRRLDRRYDASLWCIQEGRRQKDADAKPNGGSHCKPSTQSIKTIPATPLSVTLPSSLLSGEKLDTLQDNFLGIIHTSLTCDLMSSKVILSSHPRLRTVSLHAWTKETLLDGATKAFFGNRLIELEPELYENFFSFDDKI